MNMGIAMMLYELMAEKEVWMKLAVEVPVMRALGDTAGQESKTASRRPRISMMRIMKSTMINAPRFDYPPYCFNEVNEPKSAQVTEPNMIERIEDPQGNGQAACNRTLLNHVRRIIPGSFV
jgi:hypothetical protein